MLNLSASSVSKALSNSPEISEETKKKVRALAKEKKYVPNMLAVSLKSRKTNTLGVVIPNIRDEFFAMVLDGIEKETSKRGYKLIICISNESYKKEKDSLNTLINGSVDGILISLSKETQIKKSYGHLEYLLNQQYELVMFDRTCEAINCDKVIVDDLNGAYGATEHLLKSGCKNITFLSTIYGTNVGNIREKGYRDAIAAKSGNVLPLVLNIGNYDDFERKLTEHIKMHQTDAILTADELSAVYAMQTVQMHGYAIPKDVSIIGFTNGSMAKSSLPSLTTVSQHAENIGKTAVQTIIKRIEKTYVGKSKRKIIKTELIERNSTKSITPNCHERL